MDKFIMKRFASIGLATALAVTGLVGCSNSKNDSSVESHNTTAKSETKDTNSMVTDSNKPDTWIADRTIKVQAYVDDIGNALPDDLDNTPVAKELKKRTGVQLEIQYTPGNHDSDVLASQLAAGTIPDVIVSYLDNSTKKEFPILLKAAREGMFADVSQYMKDSKVYKRYYEKGYLPNDAYENITFRDEFNGEAYLLQLSIDAEDHSLEYDPSNAYIGGMYIQKAIADKLGIDPKEIRTQDQFYDLLVKIKNGGFKDDNGNPVSPLGPKYWGGSANALEYIVPGYNWGVSDGYNITKDGVVKHEVDTDYVYEKINFVRKLLNEDLMNPEFFTMDSTRAEEVSESHNSAIIGDIHNYTDLIYKTNGWAPLGPLNDFTGDNAKITHGKTGYGVWAISADAENPEEIFQLFDYLSTVPGQLLCEYGVEGLSYNMVDGKPVLTDEVAKKLNDGDTEYLINSVGAGFGGSGMKFFDFVLTNFDSKNNFGEIRPGAGQNTTFANAVKIAEDYPRTLKLVPGLDATAYLTSEDLSDIHAQMSLLNYKEMLVQAMYAKSDDEVKKIVESFRKQLKAAGNDEFCKYLQDMYEKDPTAIDFYTK